MIYTEKPKRKKKQDASWYLPMWLWIVSCIVGTLTCIAVSCVGLLVLTWGNSYSICFGTPFPSYEDVERSARFQLPPSAQKIEYDANGVNRKGGCTIWATFEMTPTDLELLQETSYVHTLRPKRLDEEPFPHFAKQKQWSQPEKSLAGHRNDYNSYPSFEQWMFVDISSPDTYTVYVITNSEWM